MADSTTEGADLDSRIQARMEQVCAEKVVAVKQQRFDEAATLRRHETRLGMLLWKRRMKDRTFTGPSRLDLLEAQVEALTERVKELERKLADQHRTH